MSRQICVVSSKGTFVNKELTSHEHMISFLWLYVLAQSAKLRVLGLELILGDGLKNVYKMMPDCSCKYLQKTQSDEKDSQVYEP